jgi:flagellar biosynthesis anti-sigma factor FlgM
MRIDDKNVAGIDSSALERAKSAEPAGQHSPVSAGGKQDSKSPDTVDLSTLAESLRSLDVESPEREARLNALAEAVQAGRYSVDAGVVSDSLIDDAMTGPGAG